MYDRDNKSIVVKFTIFLSAAFSSRVTVIKVFERLFKPWSRAIQSHHVSFVAIF